MERDFSPFPFVNHDEHREKLAHKHGLVPYVAHLGTPSEAVALYELAAGFHDDTDGYILELGTFAGWSAACMALGLQESQTNFDVLYTVDSYIWKPAALAVARANFTGLELDNNICQVIWNDLSFVKSLWRLPTRLVYVDSEHTYDHAKQTVDLCFPIIENGGWIVIHDYNQANIESVVEVVNDFVDYNSVSVFRVESLICIQKMQN